ncbi:c-type cytochrome [Janthinobacterium psychrotolerans]|uniref:Cytochrome c, mono-and diheme variants n=1 Tax=Janthinobacterium psychrotolerans TaxID=1747903 RepID=A0A1A7C3W2_9BURK|nr:cytochrome c [Janthinobacterium psychrotolerans]OBV39729.1 Cytochrome c, mono- and diheme variants [Janthinobacterium psychrotolerans]
MFKKICTGLLILLALFVLAAGAICAAYWRPALAPVDPPPSASFSAQEIEQGRILAGMGNCAACHTVKGGAAYAGGRGMATPFGTIYATNITPDPQTGIGRWSLAAFQRAMREGVARNGEHLFPVFPYTHFALASQADIAALYAWLMTRPPVYAVTPANTVPFPLNQRALQAGWKLLFFKPGSMPRNAAQGADWHRGRYLAEGLAHCAACHTPRNALGAEIAGLAYQGAAIDQWYAPPLTAANTAPLPWNKDELYAFLRTGATALHGVAAGPMSEVVHEGMEASPDADIRALAAYFADLARPQDADGPPVDAAAVIKSNIGRSQKVAMVDNDRGASLYVAACASCHSNSDGQPSLLRPELSLNSAVGAPDPSNLIQVILHGVARDEGLPGALMPAFAHSLSDADIAQLAAYLRRSRSHQPAWIGLEAKVARVRAGK